MNNDLVVAFSWVVLIAAGIGLWKCRKIEAAFYPFIGVLCTASVNEVCSTIVSRLGYSTNINNNIYVLAEAGLFTWQFKNWHKASAGKRRFFTGLMISLIVLWLFEYNTLDKLRHIGRHFRIVYSFILVILAIYTVNIRSISFQGRPLLNPVFLIGNGLIMYSTCRIVVEIFWLYGISISPRFGEALFIMLIWINLFVNLVFITAVICIPAKKYFLRPYC